MRPVALLLLVGGIGLIPSSSLSQSSSAPTTATPSNVGSESNAKLLNVKRLYIESLGDDPTSRQMQALLVDSVTSSRRFIITENKDKADAILKGVGTEKSRQEMHSTKEGTAVLTGRAGAGISDASASTETITEAHLTIRLVSPDGDVIWSTEKESAGGKYKGASADVADEAVKQLIRDLDKVANQAVATSKPQ
jgi:hypothetical protein